MHAALAGQPAPQHARTQWQLPAMPGEEPRHDRVGPLGTLTLVLENARRSRERCLLMLPLPLTLPDCADASLLLLAGLPESVFGMGWYPGFLQIAKHLRCCVGGARAGPESRAFVVILSH